jgi:type II secretory pathway pseudopilin PulG
MTMRKTQENSAGMTLLEVMFAMTLLTMVMGTLFGIALSFSDTARVQEAQLTAHDEARRALLILVPDLRQAVSTSINWSDLPGEVLTYRVAADMNGNGTAVNQDVRLEMSEPRTIRRDLDDVNGDGLTANQLIAVTANGVRVLANHLSPESEQSNAQGGFGDAEDTNGNGRMDRGIWFEPWGGGLRVTLQTQGTDRQGHIIPFVLDAIVDPRN